MNWPAESTVKFSLFYLPAALAGSPAAAEAYRLIIDEACEADSLGFDIAWLAEHHFSTYGGYIPSIPVLGAAIASRTQRIRIGAAAAILPLRDAVESAESFAMLDVVSSGRLEMGVGRGFLPHEFAARNLTLEERGGRFREGVDVLLGAWKDEPLTYHGNYYNLDEVNVFPKPVQRPHPPMWIAASISQETFELAGRRGFNLLINPYTRNPEEIARGLGWYRSARAAAGHERATARITVNQHLFVAENEEDARNIPRKPLLEYLHSVNLAFAVGTVGPVPILAPEAYESMYPDKVLFGTPDRVIDRIRAWQRQGITDICFMTQFGSLERELARASLRLFADKVMPCFR
jgi:natural product biosynthesis luciferase-like monooxygenase protein